MKFSINTKLLQQAVKTVMRVVDNNPPLPVLSNILLDVRDDVLTVSATNLQNSIVATYDVTDVEQGGSITVPAKTFSALLGTAKGASTSLPVTIEVDMRTWAMHGRTGDGWKFNIKCIDADEYPPIALPDANEKPDYALLAKAFKKALSRTMFAAAKEDNRPVLTGVFFEVSERSGMLDLAAADGYRLSVTSTKVEEINNTQLPAVVIPRASLESLESLLPDDHEYVHVYQGYRNKDVVAFVFDNVVVTSQILDGKFPDFRQIIPRDHTLHAQLVKNKFAQGVRRAAIYARDNANAGRIEVFSDVTTYDDIEGVAAVVYGKSAERGDSAQPVIGDIVECYEGGVDVSMNIEYLEQYLKTFNTTSDDNVADLYLSGAKNPIVFKVVHLTDSNEEYVGWIYVLMPMVR